MPGYDEISEELLHSARAIIEADNEMQRIKDKVDVPMLPKNPYHWFESVILHA